MKNIDSIIILRCGETKVAKEKFYGAKEPIKIWDFDVNKTHAFFISKAFTSNTRLNLAKD